MVVVTECAVVVVVVVMGVAGWCLAIVVGVVVVVVVVAHSHVGSSPSAQSLLRPVRWQLCFISLSAC